MTTQEFTSLLKQAEENGHAYVAYTYEYDNHTERREFYSYGFHGEKTWWSSVHNTMTGEGMCGHCPEPYALHGINVERIDWAEVVIY